MASIPPSQSLYLRNINDKIQKDVLKQTLYSLCIPYGRVLDIVALKTMKMRGQAFVVFGDITSATAALRQLNGRQLFGKSINVEYALSKSNVVAQRDGSFKFGELRKHMSAEERKQQLGISTAAAAEAEASVAAGKRRQSDSDSNDEGQAAKRQAIDHESDMDSDSDDENMAIGSSDTDDSDDDIGPQLPKPEAENEVAHVAPGPTLFVTNLPQSVSVDMLSGLFQQYGGFREVRRIPGKDNMAFVDYDSTDSAAAALSVLDGFKLATDQAMKVEFSR
ncbi:hypothetical protein LPJ66_001862 [Kickxella alabastrina]|uniref:Uncharacterized protein n=1 Tax=Kickxella alabastrina TaxID=61397 RepID=A0ACC1IS40_9FUNG|nr:hypothetical protein LPJ66_001862 [Kickxella alabastrina]